MKKLGIFIGVFICALLARGQMWPTNVLAGVTNVYLGTGLNTGTGDPAWLAFYKINNNTLILSNNLAGIESGSIPSAVAATSYNSIQSPTFKKWAYLVLANQLGFNTNHLMDGIWPSSGQVTIGCTNLQCSAGIFQPYMTNWCVMVAHAGGADNVTVNTNYPFGSNTKTFNNWYDAIGVVTNVVNAQNVAINSNFGVTTNMPFILAPTNNAPFQACFNFICTNSGNNELDFSDGVLAFSGPYLSTGPWTNSFTCLISTPHIASSGPEKYIKIVGSIGPSLEANSVSGPMSEPNGILGTLIVPMVYGSNANLYSFLDTRDMTGPAVASDNSVILPVPYAVTTGTPFPGASMPYSDATFEFDNLNILCPFDPNFAAFNMLGALKKVFNNCDIQAGMVRDPRDVPGGTNGFGIISPGAFSDNKQVTDNLVINQFFNGLTCGGNTVNFNSFVQSAWNALVTESSANADAFYALNVQADKNYIQVWGQGNVKIYGMWPQDTGPVWSSYPNLAVANNANFLFGSCDYDVESLFTYPTPLPTSPTLGTANLAYFTVSGANGAQNGRPTVPFVANEPVFLGPLTVYNSATIDGVGTFNVTNSPFDFVLNNADGSGENIISVNVYGTEVSRMIFDPGAGQGSLSPAGGFDIWLQSIQNGGLAQCSSWPDGQFHVQSNIVGNAAIILNSIAAPINIPAYAGTATNWWIGDVGGVYERVATNNGAGTLTTVRF